MPEELQLEFKAKLPNGKQETRRVACSREDPLLVFFEKAFSVKFKEDALGPQVMEIEGQRSSYYHFVLIDKKTGKKYMPYAEDKEGKRIYLDLRHILFSPELARSMAIEIFMVYDHRDMDNSVTTRYEGIHAWFKLDEFTSEDSRMGDVARMMRKYYMGSVGEGHRFHFLQLRARMIADAKEKPKAPSPVFLFDGSSFSFSYRGGRVQEETAFARQETSGVPDPVMILESPALFDIAASENAPGMIADAHMLANSASSRDPCLAAAAEISSASGLQMAGQKLQAGFVRISKLSNLQKQGQNSVENRPHQKFMEFPMQQEKITRSASPIQGKAECSSISLLKNSECERARIGIGGRNAMEIRKSRNSRRKKNEDGARKEKATPVPFSALSGLKAVIFDLDGVIVDSEMVHPRTFERALAKYNVKIDNAHWKRAYTGIGSYAIFDDLVKKHNIPEDARELVKRRNAIYMEEIRRNRLPVIEGFAEVHSLLLENGVKEAVASGGHTNHVQESLCSAGLKGVPFISIEMVKKGKPSPEIFLRAAKRLRVKPSECIVFEDSLSGTAAAAAAGMPCVALSTTMPSRELVARAALVVKNYRSKKLKRLLEMLLAKRKGKSARAARKWNADIKKRR